MSMMPKQIRVKNKSKLYHLEQPLTNINYKDVILTSEHVKWVSCQSLRQVVEYPAESMNSKAYNF